MQFLSAAVLLSVLSIVSPLAAGSPTARAADEWKFQVAIGGIGGIKFNKHGRTEVGDVKVDLDAFHKVMEKDDDFTATIKFEGSSDWQCRVTVEHETKFGMRTFQAYDLRNGQTMDFHKVLEIVYDVENLTLRS